MTRQQLLLLGILLLPVISGAAPVVQNPAAGNVRTTGFALCWETTEAAAPGVRVFTDAGGTQEITDVVLLEYQSLTADRREVGSSPATRESTRQLQAAMNSRNAFLARISGLQPDSDYWVSAQALDGSGAVQNESPLLPVRTAARASFIVESRQILIDLSGAAALLGDLSGIIVRLETAGSPYPLFSVVDDGPGPSRAWFDLNHFLDATGEANLVTQSGMTLELSISFHGELPIAGEFSGNQVAYDGSALAAGSSTASFIPTPLILAAISDTPTALLGQPLSLRLEANDSIGNPRSDFDRSLDLASPALAGGGLTSAPLTDGLLPAQDIILNALGVQTVDVTDPVTGASTSLQLEVLAYTYPNFRRHFYGDVNDPAGEESQNGDGDIFTNFFEFVYGLSPFNLDGGLEVDDNYNLVRRGGPVTTLRFDTQNGVDFRVTFLRHRDYQAAGIDYVPQFSSNMSQWFDSTEEPVVLAQYGEMELVYVPYPYFTPRARKARYFRLFVTIQ